MSGQALASVSVDLDGLGCYAAIHGLAAGALDERALRAVPVVALGRLCELFAALGVRATFFAIGAELGLPGAAAALGEAARGHEIASHSFAHDYALSRCSEAEIDADLAQADLALAAVTGRAPRGFRAPGYTLSPTLLAVVRRRGYLYDSSLLPSLPYYVAKAVAVGWKALRGHQSRSILGPAGQLFQPRGPRWLSGVRELPVATLPLLRGPVIGTVVLGVPDLVSGALLRGAFARGETGLSHLNLELHGIDALDASDVPAGLARVQPGLGVKAAEKLRRLEALVRSLQARAELVALEDAAPRLVGPQPGAAG